VHQLDDVARRDAHAPQRGAADDATVVLHHDDARVEPQELEQLEQRGARRRRAARR
jgi:hypothetical protein